MTALENASGDAAPDGKWLDELAIELYKRALRHGALSPDEAALELGRDAEEVWRAVTTLSRMNLLTVTDERGLLVPVDPEIAEALSCAPLERKIRNRQRELARMQACLRGLSPLYRERARVGRDNAVVVTLDDPAEVRSELAALVRRCRTEMISMQPGGGRSAETLRSVTEESLEMLERGVRIRGLYQHTARASLATRAYVHQICGRGAEVRTINEPFERLIIFDRETAVVAKQRLNGQAPGAAVITEPTVVDFLYRGFENNWQSARSFEARQMDYRQTAEQLRLSILRLMAKGLKDDVIAKRMGMSTRTCRRYIKEITDELGAASRFQAGYLAWRLDLDLGDEVRGE